MSEKSSEKEKEGTTGTGMTEEGATVETDAEGTGETDAEGTGETEEETGETTGESGESEEETETKTKDTQNSKTKETQAESKKEDDGAYSREFGDVDTQYYDKTGEKEKGASQRAGPGRSEREERKAAERLKEASKRAASQEEKSEKKGKRTVYMMRHAERMDRIFPGWTKLALAEKKGYRPYDLNQPLSLPRRSGTPDSYAEDTPITEMGYVTAQMVGRGMRVTKVHFRAIYTSPALRCIQTGHGLLKTLNMKDATLKVEPGLFEWMGWYPKPPRWLSRKELSEANFAVDKGYKPLMTEEEVGKKRSETPDQHYDRIAEVCHKILQKHKDGPILIIGHGTTVDAGTRSFLGKKTTGLTEKILNDIGNHYPYCCVKGIQEAEEEQWKVIHNALPPITFLDSNNRINYNFFNRT